METIDILMKIGEDGNLQVTPRGNMAPEHVIFGMRILEYQLMGRILKTGQTAFDSSMSFDARLARK